MTLLTDSQALHPRMCEGVSPSQAPRPRVWHMQLDLPGWNDRRRFRPVDSARTWRETLPGGGWRVIVEHEALRGVTPAMLAWWYAHVPYLEIAVPGGRIVTGYVLWHPFDHRAMTVTRHSLSGQLGFTKGADLELDACWGPFRRRTHLRVRRMDARGLSAHVVADGDAIAAIDEAFEPARGGTRCTTVMSVAVDARGTQPDASDAAFNAEIARAWVRHKIEEVGRLQLILPALHLASASPRVRAHRRASDHSEGGES